MLRNRDLIKFIRNVTYDELYITDILTNSPSENNNLFNRSNSELQTYLNRIIDRYYLTLFKKLEKGYVFEFDPIVTYVVAGKESLSIYYNNGNNIYYPRSTVTTSDKKYIVKKVIIDNLIKFSKYKAEWRKNPK